MICATNESAAHSLHLFQSFTIDFDPEIKMAVVHGGTPIGEDKEMIKDGLPHILIGTPGRVLDLLREEGRCRNWTVQQFLVDECDKCLQEVELRKAWSEAHLPFRAGSPADLHGDAEEEAGDDASCDHLVGRDARNVR